MIRILQQDNKFIKFVIGAFLVIVIVSMVVFLVPGIFDNLGNGVDAGNFATVHAPGLWGKLFGESIPVTQIEISRQVSQMAQGRQIPPYILPYYENQAGQHLVQAAVLKIEGDRHGLQVSDEDLRAVLHEGQMGQVFFPGGVYIGDDAYRQLLQTQTGMTIAQFEDQIKKELEITRLEALITDGVSVTDNQVRDSYRVSGTKVKFDYAVLSSADIAKTVNPSDADLQAFFKKNAVRYATAMPETRKIQYISFGVDQLPGGFPHATDAEVQAYYNQNLKQYKTEDEVKTRHILIASKAGADPKEDAAAKAKAEGLLKQIKAGGDFAALAKANSDDPGSKDKGGELPMFPVSGLDPAYGKAALALNPGQTSDVVKSQFGYHIIQTEEKHTAGNKPLSAVKDDIVKVLDQQKVGAAEQSYANSLAGQASKDGLEKTAAAHGLHVVTTDYLARDGVIAGLADGAPMLSQAFAANKGAPPAAVGTSDGYAVFQVVDIKAPHAPTFDEYKSHILDDYRAEQVPQMLNAQLNKLDARAKELNDLHKAAAEMKIPVKTSDLVGKDGQVQDLGAMSGQGAVAFDLAKGAISGPINTGTNGIVLSVIDKQEPTAEDMAKNFEQTRNTMLNTKRNEVFELYLGTLIDKYQKAGAIRVKAQPAQPGLPIGN
jgi:peptidyl-prolyl cis-trans isomerase D